MRCFIVLTGMVSVLSGIALQFSWVSERLMPAEPAGMVLHLFGAMAVFLGVMLFVCARDLRARAAIVAWEGVLRIFGGAIMLYYGVFGGAGLVAVLGGVFDGAVGLVYLIGLPRHLNLPLANLLLDRTAAPSN